MGTNAFVNMNPEWQEPSILWFIIAARKGEKKTAALVRIRKPIEELDNKHQEPKPSLVSLVVTAPPLM